MVDDLKAYEAATMLVWSALGGGSISLPHLGGDWLTAPQRELMVAAPERGTQVIGELGINLVLAATCGILQHSSTTVLDTVEDFHLEMVMAAPQVVIEGDLDIDISLHKVGHREVATHFIRYDYYDSDRVPVLPGPTLEVRLSPPFESGTAFSPLTQLVASIDPGTPRATASPGAMSRSTASYFSAADRTR